MNYNPTLSIVIPIFNKWNFTRSCLNDLQQLPEETHQIIIVDNGSTDGTKVEMEMLSYRMKNLTYIRNEENLGFAKACNIGWSAAYGPNIMFLNNDIRVSSNHVDWTQPIIDGLEGDSLVGPTGGYVDPANNFKFAYETKDPTKKINYVGGWCIAASRATWSKLYLPREGTYAGTINSGPPAQIFSEEFGLAYFEDTDMGFRAKRLGIAFKLIEIPVIHFGKVSSGQLNTNALYSNARSIFIKKWSHK